MNATFNWNIKWNGKLNIPIIPHLEIRDNKCKNDTIRQKYGKIWMRTNLYAWASHFLRSSQTAHLLTWPITEQVLSDSRCLLLAVTLSCTVTISLASQITVTVRKSLLILLVFGLMYYYPDRREKILFAWLTWEHVWLEFNQRPYIRETMHSALNL